MSNFSVFEQLYNKSVKILRDSLLKHGGDASNHKSVTQRIFKRIDENDSGIVSVQEMKDFILSPEIEFSVLFNVNSDEDSDKTCDLMLEQIDMDRDGTVSISELEAFLWPKMDTNAKDYKEIGIVVEYSRKAAIRQVSSVAAADSADLLLYEFASLAKMSVRRASSIDTKVIRKAFSNLMVPEFGRTLNEDEVEVLITSLDGNHDGSVSAGEFKSWLFPGIRLREMNGVVASLQRIIRTHFKGDVRALFNDFKSDGVNGIYKGDFVTKLKAVDKDISRLEANDLAARIATGGEKVITLARLTDLVGNMGATGSPRISPRVSPKVSPRSEPSLTPKSSPRLSPRISPRFAAESTSRPTSPATELTEHIGEMNTPNTPVRVRNTSRSPKHATPQTLNKQNGVGLDFSTSERLVSGDVQTPFKLNELNVPVLQRSKSISEDSQSRSRGDSIGGTTTSFEMTYNKVVHALREALLKPSGTPQTHRSVIASIFRCIDENDSGIISVQEMRDFLLSDELRLFEEDEEAAQVERVVNLLMEQLDLNRDGTVTSAELEGFLWPDVSGGDFHELGYIIECTRKAAMRVVSTAAASGSDDAILYEFALLSKGSVKRNSHQQDTKVIKKALLNLTIPEFRRNLTVEEVDLLTTCLDGNHDGSVSASEFKSWLFPGIRLREMHGVLTLLQRFIRTHFKGDVRALFDDFKSYGVDGIHKGDFVTKLKGMDKDISRHEANELAARIATGGEKVITLARLTDLVGNMSGVGGAPGSPRSSPRISPRTPATEPDTAPPALRASSPSVDLVATPGVIRRSSSGSASPKLLESPKALSSAKVLGELQLSPKLSFSRKAVPPLQMQSPQTLGPLKPPSPKMTPLSPIGTAGSKNSSPEKESSLTGIPSPQFKLSPPALPRTRSADAMLSPDATNIHRSGSSDSTPGSGGKSPSGHRKNVLMPLLPLDSMGSGVKLSESQHEFVQSPPGAEKQVNKRSPIHNKMRHSPIAAPETNSDDIKPVEMLSTIVEEEKKKTAPEPAPQIVSTTSISSLDQMPGLFHDTQQVRRPSAYNHAEKAAEEDERSDSDDSSLESLDSVRPFIDEEEEENVVVVTEKVEVLMPTVSVQKMDEECEYTVVETRVTAPEPAPPIVVQAQVQTEILPLVERVVNVDAAPERKVAAELPVEDLSVSLSAHPDSVEEIISVVKAFVVEPPPPPKPVVVPPLVLPVPQSRVDHVPVVVAPINSTVKTELKPDNSISVEELHRVKEMLFGKNAVSHKKTSSNSAYGSGPLSIETGMSESDSAAAFPGMKTPVGLSVAELAAMGYSKHTGRWRGFPFDRFTCCNTAEMVCPNAVRGRHQPQVMQEQPAMHFSKYQSEGTKHAYNTKEEPAVRRSGSSSAKTHSANAPSPVVKRTTAHSKHSQPVPRVAPPPAPAPLDESYHRFNEEVTNKRRSSLAACQQQNRAANTKHTALTGRPAVLHHTSNKAQPHVRVPLPMHTNTLNFVGGPQSAEFEQQMASLTVSDAELMQSIKAREGIFIDTHDNRHTHQSTSSQNRDHEWNDQSMDLSLSSSFSSEQLEHQQLNTPKKFTVKRSSNDSLNMSTQSALNHSSVLEDSQQTARQHQEVIDRALRLIDSNKQTITAVYESEFEALQRELQEVREASSRQEEFLSDEIQRYKRSVETLEHTLHSTEQVMTTVIQNQLQQSDDQKQRLQQMASPQREASGFSNPSKQSMLTQRSSVLEDSQLAARQHQEVVDKAVMLIDSQNTSAAYETSLQILQREVREAKVLSLQQEEFLTDEIERHRQSVHSLESSLHATEEVVTQIANKQRVQQQKQQSVPTEQQKQSREQINQSMNVSDLQIQKRPPSAPRTRPPQPGNASFVSPSVSMQGRLDTSAVSYNSNTSSPARVRSASPSRIPLVKVVPQLVTPWIPSSQNVRNCYNRADLHSPLRRKSTTGSDIYGEHIPLESSASAGRMDTSRSEGRPSSRSSSPFKGGGMGDSMNASIRHGDEVVVPVRDRPKSDAIPWVPSSQNVLNCYNRTDQNSPIRRKMVVKTQPSSAVNVGATAGQSVRRSTSSKGETDSGNQTKNSSKQSTGRVSSSTTRVGHSRNNNRSSARPAPQADESTQYRHWPEPDASLGSITSGQFDEPHSSNYSRDFLPTNQQSTAMTLDRSSYLQKERRSMSPIFMTHSENMFGRDPGMGRVSLNTSPGVTYLQRQHQSSRSQQAALSPAVKQRMRQYEHLMDDEYGPGEHSFLSSGENPSSLARLQSLSDSQYLHDIYSQDQESRDGRVQVTRDAGSDEQQRLAQEEWWRHIQELKAKSERKGFEQAQVKRFATAQ